MSLSLNVASKTYPSRSAIINSIKLRLNNSSLHVKECGLHQVERLTSCDVAEPRPNRPWGMISYIFLSFLPSEELSSKKKCIVV